MIENFAMLKDALSRQQTLIESLEDRIRILEDSTEALAERLDRVVQRLSDRIVCTDQDLRSEIADLRYDIQC